MAVYYGHHGFGLPGRYGCAVAPVGSRHGPAKGTVVYSNVMCVGCARVDVRITPAAFTIDGREVTSVRAATAEGFPAYGQEIDAIFPSSLRKAAREAQVPHPDALQVEASKHC